MSLKLNLVSTRGRHARKGDPNVRLGCVEGVTIASLLLGIYFLACAITH